MRLSGGLVSKDNQKHLSEHTGGLFIQRNSRVSMFKRLIIGCRTMLNYHTFLESLHINTEVYSPALSPGSALSRQEVKKSAVKWMSTSQKKSSTFWLRLQALAPTSKPRPRENSSFSWIRVKLLNRVSLRERRQKSDRLWCV